MSAPADQSRQGGVVDAAAEYIAYQSIDVLLSLQNPRTKEPAELTFYVMGQVKELLFKLLWCEANRARDLLSAGELGEAVRALHRIERVQRVLESTWEALNTVTAHEFNAFREELGLASGAQSYMYRLLEFALGNKSARLAGLHLRTPGVADEMRLALRSPSLWDAAIGYLRRHTEVGAGIPAECEERDFTAEYQPRAEVEAVWAAVYRDPQAHPELCRLGEALTEVAYRFGMWRAAHLLAVERTLGNKPGTGGTAGVAWLRDRSAHRFFPELWSARSLL